MIMNKETGLSEFLFCESTTVTCCVRDLVRSLDDRDDLDALRDGVTCRERSEETSRNSETIPLVILQDTCHSCSTAADIADVAHKFELSMRKDGRASPMSTNKECSFRGDTDLATLCTHSSSLSSIDFDSQLSPCWSEDDDEDLNDLYFAEELRSFLDYSSSRCDDASIMAPLDSKDESYFTEGFVDVGDLPRVSW